ncbi:MAG: hypothetical protein JWO38_2052 [Gemmataceae bacterium]|nr:hypothetical protein [Gemmataceae bacterium]
MAKRTKAWVYSPASDPKAAVTDTIKAEVERKAKDLIDTVLRPRHVKPPPKKEEFNYLIGLGTK